MCFRIDEINESGMACGIPRLSLPTLVGCSLRPLVFCSEGLAKVFNKQMMRHALIVCEPYMRLVTLGLARITAEGKNWTACLCCTLATNIFVHL